MNITVLGLGYVGCVTAACLASAGHDVVGVDVDASKVRAIQDGCSPLIEPGLNAAIKSAVGFGRLHATVSVEHALHCSEVSLICVGTPCAPHGRLNTWYVLRVCHEIGHALARYSDYHVVVVRSTLLPGAIAACTQALTSASGRQLGTSLGFATNPEFLREGTALEDFYRPPLTLIGQYDQRSGDTLARLYANLPGAISRTDPATAMMVKYACNAYHAVKIAFANEIGSLCAAVNVDAQEVMDFVCRDTKLNISPAYLRPGFAFGGSCLPKDVRALAYLSRHLDLDLPLLASILPSNQYRIQAAADAILAAHPRLVGLIGLSFKPGTDDLRESPLVQLAEILLGKGVRLRIYDEQVDPQRLIGSNRAFIERAVPHLSNLLCTTLDELVTSCDVIVVGHRQPPDLWARVYDRLDDRIVIDLERLEPQGTTEPYAEAPAMYELVGES